MLSFKALLFGTAAVARAYGDGKPEASDREQSIFQLIRQGWNTEPPHRDAKTLLDLYNTNPWVRSIVGRIGQLIARAEWRIEVQGEQRDTHPALDFLAAGNATMPGPLALSLVQNHLDLAGEAFLIIGRDGEGKPASWGVAPPHDVEFPADPADPASVHEINMPDGSRKKYAQRDVLWLRHADPLKPYGRGRSLTGAMKTELEADESAADYLRNYLRNRAVPELLISGTKEAAIAAADVPGFLAKWRQSFAGPKKAGRPFVSSRPIEVKELGGKLRDNAMAELRPELRAIISEAYGVPPEIFGRLENSNRATIESASLLLALYTLDPRLWFLKLHLEPFLKREGLLRAGERLVYVSPVQEDKAHALQVMTAGKQHFSRNEWRELAGRPRSDEPGADELPDASAQPEVNSNPVDGGNAKAQKGHAKSVSPDDIVTVSGAHQAPYVKASISTMLNDLYAGLVERYGIGLLAMLEKDAHFQNNSSVFDWLQREVPAALDLIDNTTAQQIRAALTAGAATNATKEQLAAALDAVFAAAISQRSGLIGQTEATKLAGFASVETTRQAGIGRKMWVSSGDHVVRDSHAELNGQIRNTGDDFASPSGAHGPHPGALGKASEDINCRCAVRPVLDGEKDFGADFVTWHNTRRNGIASAVSRTMVQIFELQRDVCRQALEARTVL